MLVMYSGTPLTCDNYDIILKDGSASRERWFDVKESFKAVNPLINLPYVVDGDTIDVRIGYKRQRIRILGIDTPETKDPRKPVQCFGREASNHTAQLLPPGTIVRLERDIEEHDAYNRLLVYVWRASDGLFINLDLVAGGYADILSIAPNTAHADEFRAAMNAAKTAPRGLWATCGGPGKPAS